ncbi:DUF6480 family protein [Streptomyces sp. NPDC090741]|uniref:DUF6480 family protein n=1 Tax=Streptomyces sp. NPDC090741 TaxID=3365967 RepID=UPI0037FA3A62
MHDSHDRGEPPGEAGTATGAGPYRPPKRGWARGPLVIILAFALACALFLLVSGRSHEQQ